MDKNSFPTFFNARTMGRSLREVATDLIQTESQDVVSRWFHSEDGIDLFIWSDESHLIIKQQLSFHGQVMEWNIVEGLKTGVILEDDTAKTFKVDSSEVVRYDEVLQLATLRQGIELLEHVDALSKEDRQKLQDNFRNNPTLDHISADQFMARFRNYRRSEGSHSSWWDKICTFIGRFFK
ncbi:MAG: hypothetical protein KDD22_07435 [Bdellovibrionales bacterium]|nr:hypothetical protein [Bdellovibrionales bacterium]